MNIYIYIYIYYICTSIYVNVPEQNEGKTPHDYCNPIAGALKQRASHLTAAEVRITGGGTLTNPPVFGTKFGARARRSGELCEVRQKKNGRYSEIALALELRRRAPVPLSPNGNTNGDPRQQVEWVTKMFLFFIEKNKTT